LLHEASPDDFVGALRAYGGTPEEVLRDAQLMALLEPALRADFAIRERYEYRPGPPLSIPITAIAASDDAYVPPDAVDAWREHTSAGFDRHIIAGGHFAIINSENTLRELVMHACAADS